MVSWSSLIWYLGYARTLEPIPVPSEYLNHPFLDDLPLGESDDNDDAQHE